MARTTPVVRALERDWTKRRLECLAPSPCVMGELAAGAAQRRSSVIRGVSIESTLDRMSRQGQGLPANGGLDGLEVQPIRSTLAYERFDLGEELRVEDLFEAPFLPRSSEAISGATSMATQSCSLVSTSSRTNARNLRCSAVWRWVCSTAGGGITWVTVFPPTSRVSDQLGP